MTTLDDTELGHLRRAIQRAREGMLAGRGGPFGAVIVLDGTIIGEGCNEVPSTPDPTAHAEVQAIRAACRHVGDFRLRRAVLYASCEPCPMCRAAIHWARIERVVYAADREDAAKAGFDDALLYELFSNESAPAPITVQRALADEGWAIMQEWLGIADRTQY